ncbi:DUF1579 family protein [Hymenobacter ruricola]|uniref:DUF1579 family protein n=1 Tax=Hymenobacter ruricola TaxID=2791023 RepID=A0ABS0I5N9_9BACT|nr:DUF1579 family protein [Hymenobacter ruricola]MBF9222217.1 DUF1579 family protein [Hymenobacter ruricola]
MKTILLAVLSSWAISHAGLAQTLAALPSPPVAAPAAKAPAPAADEFHQLLARASGTWTGQATMTFSPTASPLTSTSSLTNRMVMGDLFQLSEVVYNINGQQIRGVRVTGYDAKKKIFTRAMIQDGGNGVAMEGPYDPATKSTTMRYQQRNGAGQYTDMKEVYTFVDENTELLEIYRLDAKTNQEFKILNVKWTRNR